MSPDSAFRNQKAGDVPAGPLSKGEEASHDGAFNGFDSPINLPKGGGAIRGISEKFQANPVTGTSSFSIPLPVSPARGFQPELALSYDSGSGNSPFGLGWNVSVPSIVRKTDKGLPTYEDAEDSDVYSLAGAEDLVPFLEFKNGEWAEKTYPISLQGVVWEVKLYRPRIEGAFSKIERWRDPASNRIWWRTISSSNVTTVYGYHDNAYLFDPDNRARTFRWLIDFSYDDKGHLTRYVYAEENDANIDFSLSYEQHRVDQSFSQRYLKKVLYGVKDSWKKQGLSVEDLYAHDYEERDFHFQTIFDYGDHPEEIPSEEGNTSIWPARHDPFSNYRPGFEVRTYRRCRRVLLFHDFPELGEEPELIKSLELGFNDDTEGFSYMASVISTGYKRQTDGEMESKSFPAMRFEYQDHAWNGELKEIDPESLENLPSGVDGRQYQWVDLYNEGLNGVLSEQAGGLYFKQNLGDAKFAAARQVTPAPSLRGFGASLQIQDVESNGVKSLVSTSGFLKGYYSLDAEGDWENFSPFPNMPNIRFDDPNLRIIDLNGDGKPDLLISEGEIFRWYPSLGKQGYDESRSVPLPTDEDEGPVVIFSNESESIFTADMSGDGLSDIVRIRNGSVVYWPNLGHGRFGRKVSIANAPQFNYPDLFNPGHVRLADLDGSGTTDIIYLGRNEFQYWLNNSGNSLSGAYQTINPFPDVDNLSNVSLIDLLGTGTSCIVWSSPLPSNQGRTVRYIDLMAGKKPHLMRSYHNGFGKTVNLEYTPSTHFYLEDKAKGEPWVTRLHFPVHCLSKTETVDHITGARFASSYSYHHGYYDHAEREFRGFGRVDQIDTEEYEHFAKSDASNVVEKVLHQTPVLVKTWFHNGAYLDQQRILERYENEYYEPETEAAREILEKFRLAQPELPVDLTAAEWRESLRACKGMALRSETYGLDGTEKAEIPFSIAGSSGSIRKVQPKGANKHAVFQVLNSESISINLDRNPLDPRVSHNLMLDHNNYGQPTLTATVSYGRKQAEPQEIQGEQQRVHCVVTQTDFTGDDYGLLGEHEFNELAATLRSPVAWNTTTYEVGLNSDDPVEGWNWDSERFTAESLRTDFSSANEIDYLAPNSLADYQEKRLLSRSEIRFANDTLDGERAAGSQSPLGIPWTTYQLAFTPTLIEQIYQGKVDPTSLEGGYVDLNGDGNWWVPSGHALFHDAGSADSPEQRFYIPLGQRDAMGAVSWTELDPYYLLPRSSSLSRVGYEDSPDAASNRINKTIAINDYRTLSPQFVRDANENWSGVEFDALGLIKASAIMGKVSGTNETTPPARDVHTEGDNLVNPSAEMEYGFYDESTGQPAWVKSRTYTRHYSVTGVERRDVVSPLEFLEQYEYSDGSGNIAMAKAQAKPGIAKSTQPDGTVIEVDTRNFDSPQVRWRGNGRTIINNKGNPVKQFEPYFSVTPEYESAAELVETGISPILFYDAAGRNHCRINPDKTYEKVIFNPWMQQSWDVNDNLYRPQPDGSKVTENAADPDIGHLFSELETMEHSPSWYAARINGGRGAEQRRAAKKSEIHAATPAVAHTDALGRTIFAVAHNRIPDEIDSSQFRDEFYSTKTELDIEGNMLSVTDARDNTVMSYRYNMLPPPEKEDPKPALYQHSMDGGEKWTLFDIQGEAIKSWDSRDHVFENEYDGLHRPLRTWVMEADVRSLVGLTEYVDSDHPDAADYVVKNLIGGATSGFDQAGRSETLELDFKGNILSATRTLASDYKNTIDWQGDLEALLEDEIFHSTTEYDALNRVVRATSPHHSSIPASWTRPEYGESGGLDKMWVSIRGGAEQAYVEAVDYDAKGQRRFIKYGNDVTTHYTYEKETYRLSRLLTTDSNGKRLQDLNYTYDPGGNITEIRDNSQDTAYFDNTQVEPHSEYWYDPLYRLKKATGREHAEQACFPDSSNGWLPLTPGNSQELRRYEQSYEYDGAGNILQMRHLRMGGGNCANTGWTRHYQYEATNNRLAATALGDPSMPFDEIYTYNAHGSMTSLSHLPVMGWDFLEQLCHVDMAGGGHAYYVYDSSGQRMRKVIETNGSTMKERIYLGGWEIYRESKNGNRVLERETLHIMDDTKRIALIDTKTLESNSQAGFAPVIRYQLGNHLGSASMELDETGQIISYEEFHPYGTTAYFCGIQLQGISAKRYRYTGKEKDEETGFFYFGARYLHTILGRWVSADSLNLIDGLNRYSYSQNNPTSLLDDGGYATVSSQETFQCHQETSAVINRWNYFNSDDATYLGRLAHELISRSFVCDNARPGSFTYVDTTVGEIVADRKEANSEFLDLPPGQRIMRFRDAQGGKGLTRPDLGAVSDAQQFFSYMGVPGMEPDYDLGVYEIKPEHRLEQGRAEAQGYVGDLILNDVDASLGTDVERASGARVVIHGDEVLLLSWWLHEPGVILYEYWELDDDQKQPLVDRNNKEDKEFKEIENEGGELIILYPESALEEQDEGVEIAAREGMPDGSWLLAPLWGLLRRGSLSGSLPKFPSMPNINLPTAPAMGMPFMVVPLELLETRRPGEFHQNQTI